MSADDIILGYAGLTLRQGAQRHILIVGEDDHEVGLLGRRHRRAVAEGRQQQCQQRQRQRYHRHLVGVPRLSRIYHSGATLSCSLLLWVSDYDGLIAMAIPDDKITPAQKEALAALDGNYMESWFMSDVDVADWLSALTLLVLTDNVGDVLDKMAKELQAAGIQVDVASLEKSIGHWTQYGIDLHKPESLSRRFTSVSIVQLAM